jgi:multiple sugar transport system substrate-binding protein
MRKKKLVMIVALVSIVSLLMFVASGTKKEEMPEEVTLTILAMTGPWVSGPLKAHEPEWHALTGHHVKVVEVAYADIFPKIQQAAATKSKTFDMLLASNTWMADMVGWGYVRPFDEYLKDPEVKYETDTPEGIKLKNTFAGNTYGLICDNDNMYLFYRKDILGNRDYQARFKREYGYSYNVPPQTIDELIDVAEFFNGWDWDNDGEDEDGFIRSTKRGAQSYNYARPWAAPYATVPSDKIDTQGVMFFKPETMEPMVNNPGWVRGIEKFIEMGERGCGPGLDWVRGDVINDMILGHAAMAIDWGDIGPNSHGEQSKVMYNIGYALAPGTNEYWDWRSNKWVKTRDTHFVPFHAFNGWSLFITTTTDYPDLCWSYIKYIISPEVSGADVANPFSGYQPWRKSHSENLEPWVEAGWKEDEALEYINNTLEVTNHPNAVIDIRIPGAAEMEDTFETYLTMALSGEATAQEAMDMCAEAWNEINENRGMDKQIEFYHKHLGYKQ